MTRLPFGKWTTGTTYVNRIGTPLTINRGDAWAKATAPGLGLMVLSSDKLATQDSGARLDPRDFQWGFVVYARERGTGRFLGMEIHRPMKGEKGTAFVTRKGKEKADAARKRPRLIRGPDSKIGLADVGKRSMTVLSLTSLYLSGGFSPRSYYFEAGGLVYETQFGSSQPLDAEACDRTLAALLRFGKG